MIRRRLDTLAGVVAAFMVVAASAAASWWVGGMAARTESTALREADARLEESERDFCVRLQRERDRVNEAHGIIFVVLNAAADSARRRGANATAENYRVIAQLPHYQPPTDCRLAVENPSLYEPDPPVPFGELRPAKIADVLGTDIPPRLP